MLLSDLIQGQKIVLTAGGTGGHMFPAQALAEELVKQGRDVTLVTDERGINYFNAPKNVTINQLNLSLMGKPGLHSKLLAMWQLSLRFCSAWRFLKKHRPDYVLGFGGYPAFPTLLAAKICKIPFSLHEQNAVMGRVNRWFIPWAEHVGVSFPDTQKIKSCYQSKVTLTGMPVRKAIQKVGNLPYTSPKSGEPFNLLVLGGSQGAGIFSKVVPAAIAKLPHSLQNCLVITQQCRQESLEATHELYKQLGVAYKLSPFFKDIGAQFAKAHLVISRAGAATTAELLTAGRPAILVPYPHATDDHQTANANYVASIGAGWQIAQTDFTPEVLADHLQDLMEHADLLGMVR